MREAFETNWIAPVGPHVDAFEREFCAKFGFNHAAAEASARSVGIPDCFVAVGA